MPLLTYLSICLIFCRHPVKQPFCGDGWAGRPNGSPRRRPYASGSGSEQNAAAPEAAPRRGDGHLGPGNLATSRLTAELEHGFVEQPEPVQATGGELAAVRVEREVAAERDPVPPVHECAGLSLSAEAECLQPGQREDGESVVELGHVHV